MATKKQPVLYKLEKNVPIGLRTSTVEKLKMFETITPEILKLQPRVGTIPILRADITAMFKHLKKPDFKGREFGTMKIPDNNRMVRLYRKS